MIFELIPLNMADADVIINNVKELLTKAFNATVKILKLAKVPSDFKNVYRDQYNAALLLRWIRNLRTEDGTIVLGIADVDAYVDGLNFVFGIASDVDNAALVFLPRLRFLADADKFMDRIKKEVVHEVGHVFGLKHCNNVLCVMYFSNSIYDTDRKNFKFCSRCYSNLIKQGYYVNSSYVINDNI